ncbi:MAG: hypothetical protein IIC23_12065, partial [Chloroflexi bacterium]|nr:hypothetical protein [Chloroflexota bacterium]
MIFVEAKPLRQLGIGGSIGTVAAFFMAYLLYPIFLRYSKTGSKKGKTRSPRFFLPFHLGFGIPLALLLLGSAGVIGWYGVKDVNTDPSLLTYFKKSQEIHQGILAVDRFGGSNPMNFVISDRKGKKLSNR